MNSGNLVPGDQDKSEPASPEVQFALVIARMIETVKNSPEHMRQTVYDLARYKLQEQFTHADAKDIRRTQQALETAIRGVEEFSKEQFDVSIPAPVPRVGDLPITRRELPAPNSNSPNSVRPPPWLEVARDPTDVTTPAYPQPVDAPWQLVKRTAVMLSIIGTIVLAVLQREKLVSLIQHLQTPHERQATLPEKSAPASVAQPAMLATKPNPMRPTAYGVYAIGNDSLTELQLLPGRPPDVRVAVSAALKVPVRTVLPNGHPKFIVFRREAATNVPDRAEVRIVAKIAREYSTEAAGKKLDDSEEAWVIRNVSFPFRSSPHSDSPEMYELHSEDPALELTPGRYALILKNQAYDFSVEGETVDPKQCIERTVASNGTFYSDCKKP